MNTPSPKLSPFYTEALENTELGKLSNTGELFCDRYLIGRLLGRGGFGVTFLAKDMALPSQPLCVIKQLCPRYKDKRSLSKSKQRFHREAKMLATLGSHSQIPMLLNYFIVKDDFYLVQEYIEGQTLSKYVRSHGAMSEQEVKTFLTDMLYLLQYVHNHQVIHRDIKPQNIIRAKLDRRLVLIDFGAVKEVATINNTDTAKGLTTQFIGTAGFAPPEQFALRPTYASDIYALGMTCIYLLTGKGPSDMIRDPIKGQILWQEYVKISPHLQHILEKMLHPSLSRRYQSVNEVLQAINPQLKQVNLSDCLTTIPPEKAKVTGNVVPEKAQAKANPLELPKLILRNLQGKMMKKEK